MTTPQSLSKQQHLLTNFKTQFADVSPSAVITAPGRVNIIGEHVDYMGYPVLPCALNHNTTIALHYTPTTHPNKPNTPYLTVAHVRTAQHPTATYNTPTAIQYDAHLMSTAPTKWTGYIVSAYLGLIEYIAGNNDVSAVGRTVDPKLGPTPTLLAQVQDRLPNMPSSITLLVDGNVPMASGVSSSSSLVVAGVMAFAKSFGVELSPREVAELCANAERHIGTAGGGMDQAAICMSQRGAAQLISFNPLGTQVVALPVDARLVVSNTLKEAPKAEHAATHYNCRVFECRVGILILMKALGVQPDMSDPRTLTLRSLQESQKVTLPELEALIKKHLQHTPYTLSAIEALLGAPTLDALYNSSIGHQVASRNTSFEPYRRCMHVVREAQRVHQFVETAQDASKENQADALEELGKLMDASDESLNCLFDCSANEIVRMTRMARAAGAYGSRLTGAGWGGCCVSLVHKDKVNSFIQQMSKEYYAVGAVNPSWIFAVEPAEGANVQTID